MKITELENIPGIATSKKPSVHWNFLFKTLEALNFGPQFQQWNNNGYASAFFNLQRGVHQECPLSGSLFVLCTEILPNAIGSYANIEGINIYGEKSSKFHSTQMIFIFFVSDISSAQNFFQLLSAFQKCSGIEVNKSKTEGLWLGTETTQRNLLIQLGQKIPYLRLVYTSPMMKGQPSKRTLNRKCLPWFPY